MLQKKKKSLHAQREKKLRKSFKSVWVCVKTERETRSHGLKENNDWTKSAGNDKGLRSLVL